MKGGNLLGGAPARHEDEIVERLVSFPGVRIERIVSHGHSSAPGFWYDQVSDEWVALLAGEADLEIEGETTARRLRPGDWVFLPAHCRHRVARTADDEPTVWLAVHFEPSPE